MVLVRILVLVLVVLWYGVDFVDRCPGFVPKGPKDSARGFNPWCRSKKTPRPKGAVELAPEIGKTIGKPSVYHNSLPPLQGGSFPGHVPGVKTPG
jgi:hypothetical protein